MKKGAWIACFCILGFSAFFPQTVHGADKVALVIGNAQYETGPDLATPLFDSSSIALVLEQRGYDTVLLQNATNKQLLLALAKLRLRAQDAEKVVIYFAGHGLQQSGESFLLNVDAKFEGTDIYQSMIPLRILVRSVSDQARQKLIFIDACRDNPLYHSGEGVEQGQRKDVVPAGLFVLYASQPGATAFDGQNKHSPFASAFLENISKNTEIEDFARHVRVDVIRATQGHQIPWSLSSLMRPATLD